MYKLYELGLMLIIIIIARELRVYSRYNAIITEMLANVSRYNAKVTAFFLLSGRTFAS